MSKAWQKMPVKVSGILISYNHESYILQALESMLSQTYPMEIIVSDDASKDNTFNLIKERIRKYKGHHNVRVLAPDKNRGVCRNQNRAIERANGELFVLFEGDDIIRQERVTKIVATYLEKNRQIGALGSSVRIIDKNGKPGRSITWPCKQADDETVRKKGWEVVGCSLALRRDVFTEIGPISHGLISGDIAIWLRARFIKNGGLANIHENLVDYRRHDTNVSSEVGIIYSDPLAFKISCLKLLRNEVAQVYELKKIRKYLKTKNLFKNKKKQNWNHCFKIAYARAKMVINIINKPRSKWFFIGLEALKTRELRKTAVRIMALSLFPNIKKTYEKLKNLN